MIWFDERAHVTPYVMRLVLLAYSDLTSTDGTRRPGPLARGDEPPDVTPIGALAQLWALEPAAVAVEPEDGEGFL